MANGTGTLDTLRPEYREALGLPAAPGGAGTDVRAPAADDYGFGPTSTPTKWVPRWRQDGQEDFSPAGAVTEANPNFAGTSFKGQVEEHAADFGLRSVPGEAQNAYGALAAGQQRPRPTAPNPADVISMRAVLPGGERQTVSRDRRVLTDVLGRENNPQNEAELLTGGAIDRSPFHLPRYPVPARGTPGAGKWIEPLARPAPQGRYYEDPQGNLRDASTFEGTPRGFFRNDMPATREQSYSDKIRSEDQAAASLRAQQDKSQQDWERFMGYDPNAIDRRGTIRLRPADASYFSTAARQRRAAFEAEQQGLRGQTQQLALADKQVAAQQAAATAKTAGLEHLGKTWMEKGPDGKPRMLYWKTPTEVGVINPELDQKDWHFEEKSGRMVNQATGDTRKPGEEEMQNIYQDQINNFRVGQVVPRKFGSTNDKFDPANPKHRLVVDNADNGNLKIVHEHWLNDQWQPTKGQNALRYSEGNVPPAVREAFNKKFWRASEAAPAGAAPSGAGQDVREPEYHIERIPRISQDEFTAIFTEAMGRGPSPAEVQRAQGVYWK